MLAAPMPGENWQQETTLADLEATKEYARNLAQRLRPGDLLVLTGGLGAGKTTFTQALGEALAVEGQISSPTFVLSRIHRAQTDGPDLVHVDAYRTDTEGLESLDLTATLQESITVVEWGRGLVEEVLLSPEDSWLDLELRAGSGGGGTPLASWSAAAAPTFAPEAGGVSDGPQSSIASEGPDLSVAPGALAGGIQTDFRETDEEIDGTPRRALLRGYGPRWFRPTGP